MVFRHHPARAEAAIKKIRKPGDIEMVSPEALR